MLKRFDKQWLRDHALMIAPWVVMILLAMIGGIVYLTADSVRESVDRALHILASGDQARIQAYLAGFGAWAPAVSILIMIAQVIIVGIPATIVLFSNGVAFGSLWGGVINIVGRVISAIVAFGIARMLGEGAVEKLVGRIGQRERFESWLQRYGGWAVFATRVVPGMPSDILSYVAGFTKTISWRTYLMGTFFGFLPQSFIYAWLGANATDSFVPVMLAGTAIAGVLAVGAAVIQRIRMRRAARRLPPTS